MIERHGVPEIDTNCSMSPSKISSDWVMFFSNDQPIYWLLIAIRIYTMQNLGCPSLENPRVEYLGGGGGPAGWHDRGQRYSTSTIWWCNRKRVGEFVFRANAAILLLAYRAQNYSLITLTKLDRVVSSTRSWVLQVLVD